MADPDRNEEEKRRHHRQKVLWNARLCVGDPDESPAEAGFVFACRVTNMSLSGARVRIALPLRDGAEVTLRLPRYGDLPARVAWYKDGFLGVEFRLDATGVVDLLGKDAVERLRLDRAGFPGEKIED